MGTKKIIDCMIEHYTFYMIEHYTFYVKKLGDVVLDNKQNYVKL